MEARQGRVEAGGDALSRRGALRTPPRAPPGAVRQRGAVLEGAQKPSEGSSPRAPRGTLVPCDQPQGPQKRHQLVLAAGLDRAVLQGREEPLRALAGAGRLPRAAFALAYGAHDHAMLAGSDGALPEGGVMP